MAKVIKKKKRKKLTPAKVKRLRELAAGGMTYLELGRKFGIHNSFAGIVARGKAFPDAGGPIAKKRARGKPKPRSRKKQATIAGNNGRLQAPDLVSLSIDDAARFLQALTMEWPKIKESLELLNRIITEQASGR